VDGRIAAFPDARTVRYYQSIGLVQSPLRYAGRQAAYGYRHLLVVVAVKLLQAQGLTLAQVQRALAGATPAQVETAVEVALETQAPSRLPAPPDAPATASPLARRLVAAGITSPPARTRGLVAVEVAPGVLVIVDPERADDPQAVIERIAASLDS
jgi:DNA-binding transcriptional MerR regulator